VKEDQIVADIKTKQKRNAREQKDIWDIMQSVGGIATALVVALIGVTGSILVNKNQDNANRAHLYTELMTKREESENAVRKDMFTQILSSFLGPDAISSEQCDCEQVDNLLLNLDLISRNFHELMDMKPLFRYVLVCIFRQTSGLPGLESRGKEGARHAGTDANGNPEGRASSTENAPYRTKAEDCVAHLYPEFRRHIRREYKSKQPSVFNSRDFSECYPPDFRDYLESYEPKRQCGAVVVDSKADWSHFKRQLRTRDMDELFRIAERIAKKQVESLMGVAKKVRLRVNLENTCQDIRPIEEVVEPCRRDPQRKEFEKEFELVLESHKPRKFHISVNRSYPKWKHVYVKVKAFLSEEEMQRDLSCVTNNKRQSKPLFPECKNFIEEEFWVSKFDFPLNENSFLFGQERFAVVLEDIEEDPSKSDDVEGSSSEPQYANLLFLYFPATYAGVKEKSFYQQRLMDTLMEGGGPLRGL
jgi:hypothetical protein